MTVYELIQELSKHPADYEVKVNVINYMDIDDVSATKYDNEIVITLC